MLFTPAKYRFNRPVYLRSWIVRQTPHKPPIYIAGTKGETFISPFVPAIKYVNKCLPTSYYMSKDKRHLASLFST
jgi:hypothetical protein